MAIEAGQTSTLGHEGAGYIEKIHPSVADKGYQKGDKVGFLYVIGCCFECEVRTTNESLPGIENPLTSSPLGVQGCQIHNLHCTSGKQLLQGSLRCVRPDLSSSTDSRAGFTTDGFFAE